MNRKVLFFSLIGIVVLSLVSINTHLVEAQVILQQPTGAVPTVTGTPKGVMVTVPLDQEYVNVRSGPGTLYDLVGRLVAGQETAVLGRSEGGDWLLIQYYGGLKIRVGSILRLYQSRLARCRLWKFHPR